MLHNILFVSAHGLVGQSNGCSWCGNVYQPGTGYVLAACLRGMSVGVGLQDLSRRFFLLFFP